MSSAENITQHAMHQNQCTAPACKAWAFKKYVQQCEKMYLWTCITNKYINM